MKSTVLITILLAAARGFAVAAESDGKPEAPIGATATLCDGSIIKGTLQTLALPAESELLGDVTLDLLKVKSIDAASEALGRRVVSAIYVDGILVNPSYGTNGPDRAPSLSEFSTNPVVLDFPFALGPPDIRNCSVDYIIDEFKIWSVPKTELLDSVACPGHRF